MKVSFIVLFYVLAHLMVPFAHAQIKTIGVAAPVISPAIKVKADESGIKVALQHFAEVLDEQLIDAFQNTRKFKIAARSDLKWVIEEQAISGGDIASADYLIVPSVLDFTHGVETARFETLGKTVQRINVSFVFLVKIYDTIKGTLIESVEVEKQQLDVLENDNPSQFHGVVNPSQSLKLAKSASQEASRRVVDVIYPAKIIALSNNQITLNRGDGNGVKAGSVWVAYAAGDELIDPDTGVSLGFEEHKIGEVVVTQVLPKFSKAKSVENFGLKVGTILRLKEQ